MKGLTFEDLSFLKKLIAEYGNITLAELLNKIK